MERRQDHSGDLSMVRFQKTLEAFEVVPREPVDVRIVLLDQAAVAWRAPGVAAVVGAVDHEDLFAAGVFARDLETPGGHVGAVLAKHGPLREVDERDEAFSEIDHERRRVVETITLLLLGLGGGLDLRVFVAEDQRAVAAEVVDVFIAVGVAVTGAVAADGVIRRCHRQASRRGWCGP